MLLDVSFVPKRVYDDPEPATRGARSSSSKTDPPRRKVPLQKPDSQFPALLSSMRKHLLDTLDDVEERQAEEDQSRPVHKLAVGLSDEDREQGEGDDLDSQD